MDCLFEYVGSKSTKIRASVLGWATDNARYFPWRNIEYGPYEIMIAEILLKRTTAASASRIYGRFLDKYPNIQSLGRVTEEELSEEFKPIGLHNQRARAVVKLTRHLIDFEAGNIPATFDQLVKLPSLGEYSSRAILSFGYNQPAAVVDGNVARVLARIFGGQIIEHPNQAVFQRMADSLLPEQEHRRFNFAIIDLGTLVCRPSRPLCDECPLAEICDYASTKGEFLPKRSPRSTLLRHARKEKGMSLKALSQQAGTSKLTIINAEAGRTKPKEETLKKLADALGVPVSRLMEDEF